MVTPVIKGTELKYRLEIKSDGFSMVTDDFNVELYNSRFSKLIPKDEMIVETPDSDSSSSSSEEQEPEYFFVFDTEEFGTGEITMKVTAYVPDFAFPDSLRTEVYKEIICKVIN